MIIFFGTLTRYIASDLVKKYDKHILIFHQTWSLFFNDLLSTSWLKYIDFYGITCIGSLPPKFSDLQWKKETHRICDLQEFETHYFLRITLILSGTSRQILAKIVVVEHFRSMWLDKTWKKKILEQSAQYALHSSNSSTFYLSCSAIPTSLFLR